MKVFSSLAIILFLAVSVSRQHGQPEDRGFDPSDVLFPLENMCFDTTHIPSWWSYVWCFREDIKQVHYHDSRSVVETSNLIGNFIRKESQLHREVYRRNVSDCQSDSGLSLLRQADVIISCCREDKWSAMHDRLGELAEFGTFIESVTEPSQCVYLLNVCSDLVCSAKSRPSGVLGPASSSRIAGDKHRIGSGQQRGGRGPLREHWSGPGFVDFLVEQIHGITDHRDSRADTAYLSRQAQSDRLDRVRKMFTHGYDMYMAHAQPESELRPLSCDGGPFELVKIPLVTLIDTLDTLVIMGNYTEFRRAVGIVREHFRPRAFDLDVNVSVFETTIRILGGLLSAHLMAVDPQLGIYSVDRSNNVDDKYENELLSLAADLGERLLPAFSTATGIPYGTVNLRRGVPVGETEIASTAGAGSLLVEFEVLSSLMGDVRFGDAAYVAAKALYSRRSYLGLLGKHIHTANGLWHETASGVGSNADSYYEYLLKGHLLFHRSDLFAMFTDSYHAVKRHVQVGDWFTEVDMFNGKSRRNRVENLQAFWPGMESILGMCDSAARLLNSFYAVWTDIGFLPEEFDQAAWLGNQVINNSWYPLRPELIESTYYQYRSTGDRSWLSAGSAFLDTIEASTRTECGFAIVSNIGSRQLSNSMPSYFLSETCKYLYLLFDEDNFVHDRAYMFSTEAHPFDPMQLPVRLEVSESAGGGGEAVQVVGGAPLLPMKCPKKLWWDSSSVAYDVNYVRDQQPSGESTPEQEIEAAESLAMRRSMTAINSAKIAKLLRSSTFSEPLGSAYEEVTAERRVDTCYDDEMPQQVPLPEAPMPLAVPQKQALPQKLSVDAGVLGVFDVTVFTDGFMVRSQQQKDTLEITNVGESLVFVGYIPSDPLAHSKTIIGDTAGKVVNCVVSLVDDKGEMLEGDIDRSCSVATFGPSTLPFSPFIADLHRPQVGNSMGCKPLGSLQSDKGAEGLEEKEGPWWRQWPSATKLSSLLTRSPKTSKATPTDASGAPPSVVLAQRGDCLFEEKALQAQRAGAAAVIIGNSEDFLFIMSGKKQFDAAPQQPPVSPVPETDTPLETASISIPVVMITKSDAASLISALDSRPDDVTRARIDLSSFPSMLDSPYMGATGLPKLRVGRQVVHVNGGGLWGVVLSSTNGREWQLIIMSAADAAATMSTTPWTALTKGRQPVSTSFAGTLSPLEVYRGMTARQCPTHIELDGDQVIIAK